MSSFSSSCSKTAARDKHAVTSGGMVNGMGFAAGGGVAMGLVAGNGFFGGTFFKGTFLEMGAFFGGGAFCAWALEVTTKMARLVAAINHEERIIL